MALDSKPSATAGETGTRDGTQAFGADERILVAIGTRLHDLRRERGMTLDVLAQKTGFTKSYLSKIENSRKVPPIASLLRISKALEADLSNLFDSTDGTPSAERKVSLVRFDDRRPAVAGGSSFGYDYQSLVRGSFKRRMEPFIATFPNSISEDVRFEHEGEELIFVVSGRVRFTVGDEVFLLQTGDSLFFDATLPHRGESVAGDAKALIVVVNPNAPDDDARSRERA